MAGYFTESNYENAVLQLLNEELGYNYIYGPDVERDYHSPLYEDGQQPIVPGAVVGEGKRLDDDSALAVNHRCLVLPLGDVDPNDVHSVGSSHIQITDIPRAAEGHNLLRD